MSGSGEPGSDALNTRPCRSKGVVYLVGAGPGDPGLITVKGLELVEKADAIIADRLVPEAILHRSKRGAEIIRAGKRPGHRELSQEEINRLMIERAFEGKLVVRLKGGDPMVFGRGGEELEALSEAGACYEVVPGVSSYHAVPAYAGIPLTHRRFSSSVAIVTGTEAEDKEAPSVDLRKIAGSASTIVVFMGVSRLEKVVQDLLEGGLDPSTPAAIIERGTTKDQRVLVTSLDRLPAKAVERGFSNPSLVVVGDVASLAGKLCWVSCERLEIDLGQRPRGDPQASPEPLP